MTILTTQRLTLRCMTMDDLDFIHSMLSDPETMRFYPSTYDRDGAKAWVQRNLDRYKESGLGLWLVSVGESGTPVGQVGVLHQTVEGKVLLEVGYMIHRNFWRKGIAYEAASACRDYAFETQNADAVHSLIRPVNIPSQGVARKLGMSPLPETITFANLEHSLFRLQREEWEARD